MTKPVAIVRNKADPSESTYVDWNLGTLCNYACSYCPEGLHNGKWKWPAIDVALDFCERVIAHYGALGRRTTFKLTGGEPTLYKHLIELLSRIKTLGGRTGVNSNGGRELEWWERAAPHLDFAVLTHHVEFTDTEHFVMVARHLLEHGIDVHVNVTMLPQRFDECVNNVRTVMSKCDGLTMALKPLLIDFGERLYPYDDEQRLLMQRFSLDPTDEPSGGIRCLYEDGTSAVFEPQDLLLRDENHWRSWNCNAGLESLAVHADGQVFRAVCKEQGPIGSLRSAQLCLPTSPKRCGKGTCSCLADIKISKWRGNDSAPGFVAG